MAGGLVLDGGTAGGVGDGLHGAGDARLPNGRWYPATGSEVSEKPKGASQFAAGLGRHPQGTVGQYNGLLASLGVVHGRSSSALAAILAVRLAISASRALSVITSCFEGASRPSSFAFRS